MDLTCSSNPTPTPTKTPDSEIDTPPLIKPLSFSNITFNNHHHHNQQVIYKECLKNHAASIGGHAVDGCGEFMASPDSTPSDPISLKCAACGCHRNFHRREPFDNSHFLDLRHHILAPIRRFSPSPSPSDEMDLEPNSIAKIRSKGDIKETIHFLNGRCGTFDTLQQQPVTPSRGVKGENLSGRKRFRTKFTTEQKEKMHLFSEKLGWKLQKCDEAAVDEFCNEIGVGKGVLRVWMHNNKNTFGKKDLQVSNDSKNDSLENNNGFNINGTSSNEDNHQNNNDNSTSNCGLHLHISTNGSSSSS
ncbi:zinc-finger homeodomain protein 10-like [Lycium ferocissimum]|uniref:zinc-finger homeodomain protein 10-like n=1 Tax=Lycium ferocissimum TaxID=112874 RepID=UPI002815A799|nr:zinc-finger homeodomain protein 10-like [Lycium ferocissimum]